MSSNAKKGFTIYSDDYVLSQSLEKFKNEDTKLYSRILEALQLIGNFSTKVNVELYESKDTEEEKYLKLWCEDLDKNILIFYINATSKSKKTIIERITNEDNELYDLSLAKKFKLSNENIDIIKTSKVLGFKFGRLITDGNSFYDLFLGNDVCYQIQINIDEGNIMAEDVLVYLNKLEAVPTFKEYTDLFTQLIVEKKVSYSNVLLGAYKNFENICTLSIDNSNSKVLKK